MTDKRKPDFETNCLAIFQSEREKEKYGRKKPRDCYSPKKGQMSRGLSFPVLSCTAFSCSFSRHTYCPIPGLLLRADSRHLKLSDKGGVTVTFNLRPWGHRLSVVPTSGSEGHRSAVSPPRHEPCRLNFDMWPRRCCNDVVIIGAMERPNVVLTLFNTWVYVYVCVFKCCKPLAIWEVEKDGGFYTITASEVISSLARVHLAHKPHTLSLLTQTHTSRYTHAHFCRFQIAEDLLLSVVSRTV